MSRKPPNFSLFKKCSTCTKVFMLQSSSENSQKNIFHKVDYWLQFGIKKIIFRPLVFPISLIFHEHSKSIQTKDNQKNIIQLDSKKNSYCIFHVWFWKMLIFPCKIIEIRKSFSTLPTQSQYTWNENVLHCVSSHAICILFCSTITC